VGSRTRPALISVGVSVALAFAAESAPAAVTLGPNPLPQRTNVTVEGGARIFTNAVVLGVMLASPIDGIVTRWRVRRGSGGGVMDPDTITLRILRPTGVLNEFTAVGTSDAHNVPGGGSDPIAVYDFPTRQPIKAGDRIGLGTSIGEFTGLAQTGLSYLKRINALADGQTATFTAGAFAQTVLINADVEPDANCDGLGDETQETVVSGGCLPPKAASLTGKKAKATKAGAPVKVACALAGGDCAGNQISLTTKLSGASKAERVTLGSASFSIAAGQSQVVSVPLSKRARALLRRLGKVKAKVTIAGGSTTSVGTLKIKR
jgi:hypothetical protein